MITFLKTKEKKKKGFTLLFAVLVSSLVISISATVISIALRQTIISGTSRESQYAFYATNTMMECVFYWDVVGIENSSEPVFLAPNENYAESAPDKAAVTCGKGNILTGDGFDTSYANNTKSRTFTSGDPTKQTVYMEISDVGDDATHSPYCAEATITKEISGSRIKTTIEAKGYNTCDLSSPRAVERGLIQSY